MIYVIGSGPSGVSISKSLLNQGLEVTILDVGLIFKKSKKKPTKNKFNRKLAYGSTFAYKEEGIKEFSSSYAKGGLSNVWGAAISPFTEDEISDWPISLKDLSGPYQNIASLINVAGHNEEQVNFCKLFNKNLVKIKPSNEAMAIYSCMGKNITYLNKNGINVDFSRLAFTFHSSSVTECTLCGKCLEGCPEGLLYNSVSTLNFLKKNKNFTYIDDIEVISLSESKSHVTISSKEFKTQKIRQFQATRVYLAAGVLSTAKILLSSFENNNVSLSIKSSQYFLFPGLITGKLGKNKSSDNHAMSQLFIKIYGSFLKKNPAHLQMYTKSDFLFESFKSKVNFLPSFIINYFKKYLDRVVIFQGYLHSHETSSRYLHYSVDLETKKNKLRISNSKYDRSTKKIVRKILLQLYKNKSKIGFLTLPFLYSIGNFGYGFHVGSSFPMSKNPQGSQSDIYGRPYGLKKIHIVDASIFPSIPASTITYTVMANSYRIGDLYADYKNDN